MIVRKNLLKVATKTVEVYLYKIKMTKSGLFIFSKQRFFKKDFFSPKKLNKLCMLQRILILGILKLLT